MKRAAAPEALTDGDLDEILPDAGYTVLSEPSAPAADTAIAASSGSSFVLGSSSKWRLALLKAANPQLHWQGMAPDIDEYSISPCPDQPRERCDPETLTRAIAEAKAEALIPKLAGTDTFLVTADQVAHHGGVVREKPTSEEQCRAYLASYTEDAPAVVVTSVVVVDCLFAGAARRVGSVRASQAFRQPIPPATVDAVLAKGDIMSCCGGFMVDEPLLQPFLGERVGTEDEVIGLPLLLTQRLLSEARAARGLAQIAESKGAGDGRP